MADLSTLISEPTQIMVVFVSLPCSWCSSQFECDNGDCISNISFVMVSITGDNSDEEDCYKSTHILDTSTVCGIIANTYIVKLLIA